MKLKYFSSSITLMGLLQNNKSHPVACEYIPPVIRIRRGVLKKLQRYSSLVPKLFSENVEFYGYLVGRTGTGIVDDCFLAEAQHGDPVHVSVEHEGVARALERISKDFPEYEINGWFHNHPFGGSFSETDKQNAETVLAQSAATLKYDGNDVQYTYSVLLSDSIRATVAFLHPCGYISQSRARQEFLRGGPKFTARQLSREIKEAIVEPKEPRFATDEIRLLEEAIHLLGVDGVKEYLESAYHE